MMETVRQKIGEFMANIPVDSHTLGDLVQAEDRIAVLEQRVEALVIRAEKLEEAHSERGDRTT
jgi:hypothetical protein